MGSKQKLSILKGPHRDIVSCSLHEIFQEKVRQNPNQPALIYKDEDIYRSLTYDEVNQRSNKYGRVLVEEYFKGSLKPNQDGDLVIAVCMQPSESLVMVFLAAWKAGVAYLPIDPSFPANRISHILYEARPIMVICDDDIDTKLFGSVYTLKINELEQRAGQMDATNIPETQMLNVENDLAVILYTSGSTGVPKGVWLSHAVVLNRFYWQWETFPYTADELVGVFKSTITFVDSVCEIFSTLLNGIAVLIVPKAITKDPGELVKLLDEYQICRLMLVPTLLQNILMYLKMNRRPNSRPLRNLRHWVCSGEQLPKQLAEQFFDYFQEGTYFLHNFYGSTEIMGDVTYFTCENKEQLNQLERVPIGLPIFNTVIYIQDQDYKPVKIGEIGEIFVAGLSLAHGYVNGRDPERFFKNPLSSEDKFSRLYRTGDFGSIQNGYIMFDGRTDSQMKIRGHRVDLSEVEKHMHSLDIIEKAIVLCYCVEQIDRSLLAFVKLKDASSQLTGLQIEAVLKSKLADYMIPHVVIIDHVPLLVNGKVDRQELFKLYETTSDKEMHAFDFAHVPDDMKLIASDLFNVVRTVIGRSSRAALTVESNFYEIGGNSLNSITTVMMLREKGYHIEISEFITAKNLGEVLNRISSTAITIPEVEKQLDGGPLLLNMKAFPLTANDKEVSIKILADCFFEKGDLEYYIRDKLKLQDLVDPIEQIWDDALGKSYSFTIRDMNSNKTIGVSFNFDARDEPTFVVNSFADSTFDIIEVLEEPFREKIIPKGLNKVMHACLIGTATCLNSQENIACIQFMEEEILRLARKKKFIAVLASNVSPLTQQLAKDVFNYTCVLDYKVNEYIHKDGTRPFALAPDSQRFMIHYKEL